MEGPLKRCTKCFHLKMPWEFGFKNKKLHPGKRSARCLKCAAAQKAAWKKANPEKARETQRAAKRKYQEAHPFRVKASRARYRRKNTPAPGTTYDPDAYNSAKDCSRNKAWRLRNPEKETAKRARRRAQLLSATPAWADHAAITEIYARARVVSESSGRPMHVDHIVPLKGRNVCGLHWEENLQIIPALENLKKTNRLEETAAWPS